MLPGEGGWQGAGQLRAPADTAPTGNRSGGLWQPGGAAAPSGPNAQPHSGPGAAVRAAPSLAQLLLQQEVPAGGRPVCAGPHSSLPRVPSG